MSVSQSQKSSDSLQAAALYLPEISKVLEVSSKSRVELDVALSAFNLTFRTLKRNQIFCVECAYQGGKVFEFGGLYRDLFFMTAREAKRDSRLTTSGRLTGFQFFGANWKLESKTAFYEWLYLNALAKHPELNESLTSYSAFTDIEFNPERSVNCPAYSVVLYVIPLYISLLHGPASSRKSLTFNELSEGLVNFGEIASTL